MLLRGVLWSVVAILAMGAFTVVADAWELSDEELIAELADEMTDPASASRIDAVLERTDPTRAEVEIRGPGLRQRFTEDHDDPELIRGALAPLAAHDLDEVQRSIEVEGDQAQLSLRVRADGEVADLRLELRRDGQSWLVTEVTRL